MRFWGKLVGVATLLCSASATTLQQLTLDDISQKSTLIVRGTAAQTGALARGSIIYTHYRIQVSEQWKGAPVSQIDVAVPGGGANGVRQTYSGAPIFTGGQEYIFFLWTSRTGLTQVIGLSQGLFLLQSGVAGEPCVTRNASSDRIVDPSGREINDVNFSMGLSAFKTRVLHALPQGAK